MWKRRILTIRACIFVIPFHCTAVLIYHIQPRSAAHLSQSTISGLLSEMEPSGITKPQCPSLALRCEISCHSAVSILYQFILPLCLITISNPFQRRSYHITAHRYRRDVCNDNKMLYLALTVCCIVAVLSSYHNTTIPSTQTDLYADCPIYFVVPVAAAMTFKCSSLGTNFASTTGDSTRVGLPHISLNSHASFALLQG